MKPFENIEIELLNDMTDASTITVDGIEFGFTGKIDFNNFDQKPIHEALRRMEWILKAYRDGNKDAAKWNFEHFCWVIKWAIENTTHLQLDDKYLIEKEIEKC